MLKRSEWLGGGGGRSEEGIEWNSSVMEMVACFRQTESSVGTVRNMVTSWSWESVGWRTRAVVKRVRPR